MTPPVRWLATQAAVAALLPPAPLTPREGMNLTDVALHFQFRNCTMTLPGPVGCSGRFAFNATQGVVILGLQSQRSASSSAACERLCCMDNGCAVWQFADHAGCQIGSAHDLFKGPRHNISDWAGGIRMAPLSWEAEHCATYEVQLSREQSFQSIAMSLPTLAYCCPAGGQDCKEARSLRRCDHRCDPTKASLGSCDSDTLSHAMWHARPGIQSFWSTLYANVTGMFPRKSLRHEMEEISDPSALPGPGLWYWRVRGFSSLDNSPTNWSHSSHFLLNSDLTARPPRRAVDSTRPLFHLEGWSIASSDFANFRRAVPPDLRSYVAFVFDSRVDTEAPNQWSYSNARYPWGGKASYQLLGDYIGKALEALPDFDLLISVEAGPHWAVDYQSLAEIEWLFQRNTRIAGIRVGEMFWNWVWYQPGVQALKQSYTRALITLCSKYGRRFIWGDGNHLAFNWNSLLNNPASAWLRPHASTLVLLPKTNIIPHWYSSQSALQGAWLTNRTSAFGIWAECWYWSEAGWGKMGDPPSLGHNGNCKHFPSSMWAQSFLLGIAQGGTVFAVEGEGCTTTSGAVDPSTPIPNPGQPALWNHSGAVLPAWSEYLVPFFRAVVAEGLIPSRAEVLRTVKVSIIDDVMNPNNDKCEDDSCNDATCFSEGPYQRVFNASYRYRTTPGVANDTTAILTQLIPSTGRFHFLPILPNGSQPLPSSTLSIQLSDPRTQSLDSMQALLEPLYPKPACKNCTAWTELVAGRFFVMAAAEWRNVSHFYSVPLAGAKATSLQGSVGVSELRVGRFLVNASTTQERLFVLSQSNWRGAGSVAAMKIVCTAAPDVVQVTPAVACKVPVHWAAGVLTVVLDHNAIATVTVVLEWK